VRRAVEPAVRIGFEAGQQRARSGALTRTPRGLPGAPPAGAAPPQDPAHAGLGVPGARAAGRRRYTEQWLHRTAEEAAAKLGHPDIGSLVRARWPPGKPGSISREAGLHKDWLCRHLATVDPATAAAVAETELEPVRHDARWLPSLQALGFADVRSYLVERHVVDTWTVHSIRQGDRDEPGHGAVGAGPARGGAGAARGVAVPVRGAGGSRRGPVRLRRTSAATSMRGAPPGSAGVHRRRVRESATWLRRRAGLPN